jgi:hypothetical protein
MVLTAKPRLVAKSGTGNAPRTLGKVNGAGSGPDASKVWNKNQPVPPAPPKQFTDEELKQQYGIHLATRLQSDEPGKEAKWADIEDDEDDWAPDTVQWMDGTKSSGAVAENELPLAEEPKPVMKVMKAPETRQEPAKPPPAAAPSAPSAPSVPSVHSAPSAPKPSATVIGGTKTILKPGAHASPATGKSSLVLKGQPEKPTLVTKSSGSDKKSPWASLPPVEKVPPVQINPPAQQPQQRFSQRESYGYDPMPSLPAKEIAPDDFNRTWRDDRGARPELFNSQSGRYEPVNDMRRGSMRDPGLRQQPSVLQRPSQDGAPAGPSAAFQTSRSGGDTQTWGRRRNSSNVSGGNGRRMSFDRRPPDMPNGPVGIERRGSHSVNDMDPLDSASSRKPSVAQAISPNVANAQPASPFGSVASSGAHDLPASTPVAPAAPVAPAEDPVEVQKRLMTDKIERARLKKQQEREAEEKEEAERKERLAKRLAAMGPPKAKEQSPVERSPKKDKSVPATVQSPPKPPVPTADGEIAQYGMMKVHHPQPVKKTSSAEGTKPAASAESVPGLSPVKTQTENQTRPAQPFDNFTRDNDKTRPSGEQSKGAVNQPEGAVPAGPRTQVAQAGWQAVQSSRGWTSQVWGPPPTKERALGNGTFGSGYERGQPRASTQQQVPAQTQPPPAVVNLNIAPKLSSSQSATTAPAPQAMLPPSVPLPVQAVASARPGPIAPPTGKGWGNFAAHIAQDDRDMAAKARSDLERLGGETFRPEIRETYKDQLGQSQITKHDKVAGKKDEAVKVALDAHSPQQTLNQAPLQQSTGPRASRFFPRSTEISQPSTTASTKADSPPPPPETETHPAFTGSSDQPLVRLPKPSPRVRLPPAAAGGSAQAETPVSMPTRGNPGLGARPLTMNPEWQARFNKLLEKPGTSPAQAAQAATNRSAVVVPTVPVKVGSLPIAASSKAALDVRGHVGSAATVSLPSAPLNLNRNFANDRGRDAITRKGTEVLFEDREFGSLPTVKLAKVSHLAADEPVVRAPTDDTVLIRFKKIENPFTQRRLEAFDIERTAQKIDVVIRITAMRQSIIKPMPRGRRGQKTSSQYNKPKRINAPNGSPSSGLKDRPRKTSQQSQNERPNSSSRPSPTNVWNNSSRSTPSSTPAHQATTWARRAAAPVH